MDNECRRFYVYPDGYYSGTVDREYPGEPVLCIRMCRRDNKLVLWVLGDSASGEKGVERFEVDLDIGGSGPIGPSDLLSLYSDLLDKGYGPGMVELILVLSLAKAKVAPPRVSHGTSVVDYLFNMVEVDGECTL